MSRTKARAAFSGVLVVSCLLALLAAQTAGAITWSERRITDKDGYADSRDFDGTRITMGHEANEDVFVHDLRTGVTENVTDDAVDEGGARISGERVCFWATPNPAYLYIHVLDLATGERTTIADADRSKDPPRIEGDSVVWAEEVDGQWDVYHYDCMTGATTQVTDDAAEQHYPDVFERAIVYEEYGTADIDLELHDLDTGETHPVASTSAVERRPIIFGDRIAYLLTGSGDEDVAVHDLRTGKTTNVSDRAGSQGPTGLFRDQVVFSDASGGDYDVIVEDLATGEEHVVVAADKDQTTGRVYGSRVAWTDARYDPDPFAPPMKRALFVGDRVPEVERVWGADRYATALAVSQAHFYRASTVVLATGADFPDALAASGLAGVHHAPLLLTRPGALPPGLLEELDRLGTSSVLVVGGEGAVSASVTAALEAEGLDVERLGGSDRYATAVLVAQRVHDVRDAGDLDFDLGVFIARGDEFPDALACAPVAYRRKMPVLLVRPTDMPPVVENAFESLPIKGAVVAGGTGAVAQSVQDQVDSLLAGNGGTASLRWAGLDRYATARAIAAQAVERAWAGAGYVGIATGRDFPDALAGGVAAGREYGVLMLTAPDAMNPLAAGYLDDVKRGASWVEVYGGAGAVSDSALAGAQTALE